MADVKSWEKECLTKKRYDSFFLADKVAKRVEEEKKLRLYVYRCASCEHWHLTKQPQSRNRYQILRVC